MKPEPERRGLQHLPRGPADVNVSEKHVWSLLLHKHFLARKLGENASKSYYTGAERHVTCERFKNAASRAKTNVIVTSRHEITFATVHVTDDDLNFCDGPGLLIRKTVKPCINSMWIALLIHGFLSVKTWLLIACDTAFYAIIGFKMTPSGKQVIFAWRLFFNFQEFYNLPPNFQGYKYNKLHLRGLLWYSSSSRAIWSVIYEPRQANLCLRAFRHDKVWLRMPSHSEGPWIWLSVWRFLLTHCLYERAAEVLARLRGCAGSPEPSLLA